MRFALASWLHAAVFALALLLSAISQAPPANAQLVKLFSIRVANQVLLPKPFRTSATQILNYNIAGMSPVLVPGQAVFWNLNQLYVRSQALNTLYSTFWMAYTNVSLSAMGLDPAVSACSPCYIVYAQHETPSTILVLVDGGANSYLARFQINQTLPTSGGFKGLALPVTVLTPPQPSVSITGMGVFGASDSEF